MPAVKILGVPENTSKETLQQLRKAIISAVERKMEIKPGITRVFFPEDRAGDPDEGQDSCIWGFLYTGMFKGQGILGFIKTWRMKPKAKATTYAIAELIRSYIGNFEVEIFVRDLDASTKTLIHPD